MKRKYILSWLTAAALTLSLMPTTALAVDNSDPPTEIVTIDELIAMSKDLSGNYKLTKDLDFSDINCYSEKSLYDAYNPKDGSTAQTWIPIGSFVPSQGSVTGEDPDPSHAFTGTFDGGGFTISNLTIDKSFEKAGPYMGTGLFGVVIGTDNDQAAIKNLTISDTDIKGFCLVGAAVGLQGGNSIVCEGVSGVVGTGAGDGKIEACDAAKVTIKAAPVDLGSYGIYPAACAGAVVGGLTGGSLSDCTAIDSSITATGADVYVLGGVCEAPYATTPISNCDATNVTITSMGAKGRLIGGVLGYAGTYGSADPTSILNCDAKNIDITVSNTTTYVGGVVGGSKEATHDDMNTAQSKFGISSCSSDSNSSISGGSANLGAIVGGMSNNYTIINSTGNSIINAGNTHSGNHGSSSDSSSSTYSISITSTENGTISLTLQYSMPRPPHHLEQP